MNTIILFKKTRKLNYDEFETKIENMEIERDKLNALVEIGELTIDKYRKSIASQLKMENEYKSIIIDSQNDKFNPEVKKELLRRIDQRIEIIENELNERIDSNRNEAINEDDILLSEREKNDVPKYMRESIIKQITIKNPDRTSDRIQEKTLYYTLKNRLTDYEKVLKYFTINDIPKERIIKAESDIQLLKESIQKLEKNKPIDKNSIPEEFSYEYLYGCSSSQRKKIFDTIIQDTQKRKSKDTDKYNLLMSKLKELPEKEVLKNKEHIKRTLEDSKAKIEKYDMILNKLKKMQENEWIPPPEICEEESEIKNEISNSEIDLYELLIEVGNISPYDSCEVIIKIGNIFLN